jgi:four helix bundle protein
MNNNKAITDRTFDFAIRIIELCQALDEKSGVSRTISKQLVRSGTSIGGSLEESQSGQTKYS